jgi:rubredoxin
MTEAGYRKRESVIRGFIDGEAEGLPEDRECPDCGISRSDFERMPV